MTELSVSVDARAGGTVLTPHGKVLFDTREPLDHAVKAVLLEPRPRIVIDLHDVTMCDSSGLQLIIDAQRQAVPAGGWVRLCRPQALVRRVLEITNLHSLLPIYDNVDEAVSVPERSGSDRHSGFEDPSGDR